MRIFGAGIIISIVIFSYADSIRAATRDASQVLAGSVASCDLINKTTLPRAYRKFVQKGVNRIERCVYGDRFVYSQVLNPISSAIGVCNYYVLPIPPKNGNFSGIFKRRHPGSDCPSPTQNNYTLIRPSGELGLDDGQFLKLLDELQYLLIESRNSRMSGGDRSGREAGSREKFFDAIRTSGRFDVTTVTYFGSYSNGTVSISVDVKNFDRSGSRVRVSLKSPAPNKYVLWSTRYLEGPD